MRQLHRLLPGKPRESSSQALKRCLKATVPYQQPFENAVDVKIK